MKYYDKAGKIHNSLAGAAFSNFRIKVDKTMKDKIPGYGLMKEAKKYNNENIKDDIIDADFVEENTEDLEDNNITNVADVEIDYENGNLVSVDGDGNVVAEDPIPENLQRQTCTDLFMDERDPNPRKIYTVPYEYRCRCGLKKSPYVLDETCNICGTKIDIQKEITE